MRIISIFLVLFSTLCHAEVYEPNNTKCDAPGRTCITVTLENSSLSSTPTVIRTVTSGTMFYLQKILISCVNTANAIGRFRIEDNGTVIVPKLIQQQPIGGTAGSLQTTDEFRAPMKFSTNLQVSQQAGTITCSMTIEGYEQ